MRIPLRTSLLFRVPPESEINAIIRTRPPPVHHDHKSWFTGAENFAEFTAVVIGLFALIAIILFVIGATVVAVENWHERCRALRLRREHAARRKFWEPLIVGKGILKKDQEMRREPSMDSGIDVENAPLLKKDKMVEHAKWKRVYELDGSFYWEDVMTRRIWTPRY